MSENRYDKIQVLVVDDSAFMRSALRGMINSDPQLNVVDTARDGAEAIDKIAQLKPDIVTLDIEMPRMDGLAALKIIMEEMPLPVIMVSSLAAESAQATMEALSLGAVDFVCKNLESNALNIMNVEAELKSKIKEIVRTMVPRRPPRVQIRRPAAAHGVPRTQNMAVVAVGVSTGGPRALMDVIPYLPKDFLVPVLVVQHMPVLFTKSFAERLDSISELRVKEAEDGEPVEPGTVIIGRGGIHLKVRRTRVAEVCVELNPHPVDHLYHPSVDIMMFSAVEAYQGRVLGVIMTGMGSDGTEGMRDIKRYGGKTLAQDEASCVVYGMPRSAVEAGIVDKVVPLSCIASEIVNMV
jgi:two-component system chemotaxis response regulator CheB